jgi:hypothetical protein
MAPVVYRPARGRLIYVSNVKRSSLLYLLRGTRLAQTHVGVTSDGQVTLPARRLAQVADVLAEDRGEHDPDYTWLAERRHKQRQQQQRRRRFPRIHRLKDDDAR